MLNSKKIYSISEFERVIFQDRFKEELEHLQEIRKVLDESKQETPLTDHLYKQRIRAFRLERDLKHRLKQVQLNKRIQMLSLNLKDMKQCKVALKKRLVRKLDSNRMKEKVSFLENKFQDEIYREECGLNEGFKSFPITQSEIQILLSTMAV